MNVYEPPSPSLSSLFCISIDTLCNKDGFLDLMVVFLFLVVSLYLLFCFFKIGIHFTEVQQWCFSILQDRMYIPLFYIVLNGLLKNYV